jgi:hypothetical protein
MRVICSIQNSDVLCFQILLSFVPTILHFLRCFAFPSLPGQFSVLRRDSGPGVGQGQTDRCMTITIGYHKFPGLSSGKCEKKQPVLLNLSSQLSALTLQP